MKRLLSILLLAGLVPAFLCPAFAGGFIEAGVSHYLYPANGLWWQDGFPHSFDRDDLYLRAGYRGAVNVSAFSLGRYALTAKATPDDNNYDPGSPTHCRGPCLPLSTFATSGRVYGLAVSKDFTVEQIGRRIAFEVGPTYYHQGFALAVDSSTQQPPSTFSFGPASNWRLGWLAGVRYGGERVTLGLYYYRVGSRIDGWDTGVERNFSAAVGFNF